MTPQRRSWFRPGVESLDARALLSTLSASLAKGVLTIRREDDAVPIHVEIRAFSADARRVGRSPGGTILVEGLRRFPARMVRAVRIVPGPSNDRIQVTKSASSRIQVRFLAPTGRTHVSPSPTATPPLAVPGVTGVHSDFEAEVFDRINAERSRAGVAPLAVDARLVTAAQIHGRDMAAAGVLAHDLPGAALPTLIGRARSVGYKYRLLGENIAYQYPDAATFVAEWMASDIHRANILNPNFRDAGVGLGRGPSGVLYLCQEFGAVA